MSYLLLVRDRELLAGCALVLLTDKVGDGLILGLLNGALVVLRTLSQDVLLDVVDSWTESALMYWQWGLAQA